MSHVGIREQMRKKHKKNLNTRQEIHTGNTQRLLLPLVWWETPMGGHRNRVPECPWANVPSVLWSFNEFVGSRGWEDKPCVSTAAMQKKKKREKIQKKHLFVKTQVKATSTAWEAGQVPHPWLYQPVAIETHYCTALGL